MTDQEKLYCVCVQPRRVLWHGGRTHYAYDMLDLPLADAIALDERGTVILMDDPPGWKNGRPISNKPTREARKRS